MEAIIEQVKQWEYYQNLSEELHGFRLERMLTQTEAKLFLFGYHCPRLQRSAYALYDAATKEFMLHTVIGLFTFCDIQYISVELAGFEQTLKQRFDRTLQDLTVFRREEMGSPFIAKQILEKDFNLPEQLCGFELFIRPDRPVKIINGSFIVIDYSDFATESSLTVYYNIYRDEFFSERRVRRLPQIVADFDSKEVDELAEKLADRLQPALSELRDLLTV